jgi:hypothetical protein
MIVKSIDPKDKEIAELTALLKQAQTPDQKFLIERELRSMKTGIKGEEDCAYYIDFYFGSSKNWVALHDLRIEHEGNVAQIDHLMINRLFEVYVIESKNFSYEITINDAGEFTLKSGNQAFGIPSPIEQNRRHIFLLEKFIAANAISPNRLGIPVIPRYKSLILMSPKSVITRPDKKKFDTESVIKADVLRTKIDEYSNKFNPIYDFSLIGNLSTLKSVREFADRLKAFHSRSAMNYQKKFGIEVNNDPIQNVIDIANGKDNNVENKYYCFKCKKAIPYNVARYCWNNKERFGGKAFCYDCQKTYN